MKAKCLKIYEFGNPQEVVRLENKTIAPPQGQEILVRMLARPINPSDLIPIWGNMLIESLYQQCPAMKA